MAKYNWFKWRHFKRVHGIGKMFLDTNFKLNMNLCSDIPRNPKIGDTFFKEEDGCVYIVLPAVEEGKMAAVKISTLEEFNKKMGLNNG